MAPVLKVSGLSKFFFDRPILHNINLCLEPGRFHVLLGRNGVGKSTLMKVIMGQEAADVGRVELLGHDRASARSLNGEIGFVSECLTFQIPLPIAALFEKIGGSYPRWDHDLFLKFLADFRLNPDGYFASLSRGQRMQVAFAAAAALRPKLFLLDEITSVLDADARNRVLEHLRECLAGGASVLLTTNIVSEAQNYADHLILMESGRIGLDAPVREVSERFCKIRRKPGEEHRAFSSPASVSLGANSDRSVSYILERKNLEGLAPPAASVDQRRVTLEEIFLYFNRNQAA